MQLFVSMFCSGLWYTGCGVQRGTGLLLRYVEVKLLTLVQVHAEALQNYCDNSQVGGGGPRWGQGVRVWLKESPCVVLASNPWVGACGAEWPR
jgi:hypothetical protein